jgi:mono/diheme cytochrome c family protein
MLRRGLVGLILGAALIGTAHAQSGPLKRGDYLVNTVLACGLCHTPKGPGGDIMDKAFSGGLSWDKPAFQLTAPNITPDKATGIGIWSDSDIKTLLRTGIRPNGTSIATVMPTSFYGIITERDMNAIVAYLRTLKPVANQVPDPVYLKAEPHQVFPGAEKPYTEAELKDKLKRGFYLATLGHCMECHTPMGPHGREWVDHMGAGGAKFKGKGGSVLVSRNITPNKDKGLGGWTDAEVKRAMVEGVAKDGSHLSPPMPFHYYAKMTGADVDDIIGYLRTIPALE